FRSSGIYKISKPARSVNVAPQNGLWFRHFLKLPPSITLLYWRCLFSSCFSSRLAAFASLLSKANPSLTINYRHLSFQDHLLFQSIFSLLLVSHTLRIDSLLQ